MELTIILCISILFQVECIIDNMGLKLRGDGKSKKFAKRAAAQVMLNKLRAENLDKVDELLDRLPRNPNNKNSAFDLVAEIMNMKKNRDAVPKEDRLQALFYKVCIVILHYCAKIVAR